MSIINYVSIIDFSQINLVQKVTILLVERKAWQILLSKVLDNIIRFLNWISRKRTIVSDSSIAIFRSNYSLFIFNLFVLFFVVRL